MHLISTFLGQLSLTSLILSVLMGVHSEGVFVFWVSMELNLVSFVLFSFWAAELKEGVLKYFLAQSLGSLLLLSCFLAGVNQGALVEMNSLVWIPLALKLGLPPLHWWVISLFQDSSWLMIFMLSTVQKILPLYLVFKLGGIFSEVWLFLSASVSSLSLISALLVKKVLAYSSILSVAWMLSVFSLFQSALVFMLGYSLGLGLLTLAMNQEVNSLSKGVNFLAAQSGAKVPIVIAVLSMAGVPPLVGFFAKVSVLWAALASSVPVFMALLVTTPPSLYAYSRLSLLALKSGGPSWGVGALSPAKLPEWALLVAVSGGGLLAC